MKPTLNAAIRSIDNLLAGYSTAMHRSLTETQWVELWGYIDRALDERLRYMARARQLEQMRHAA